MAIARCISTGLTVPECSCSDCLRQLVERHAPEVLEAPANGRPESRRPAARAEDQERAREAARGA
jgi:hypothetical protein